MAEEDGAVIKIAAHVNLHSEGLPIGWRSEANESGHVYYTHAGIDEWTHVVPTLPAPPAGYIVHEHEGNAYYEHLTTGTTHWTRPHSPSADV